MSKSVVTLSFLIFAFLMSPAFVSASVEAWAIAKPEYDIVFPDDQIVDFKIIIQPQDWEAMQDNMRKLYGEPGKPLPRPNPGDKPVAPGFSKEKPMWVNAKIEFNGQTWNNVAVRYKGNSSLMFPWMRGSHKLPFKIDFSKFEKKRKFYGFTELSLSNNFADNTLMREPLAYRLLSDMGLPASHTALYRMTVDYGNGAKDYGIYTSIEVTNDTVVGNFFGEDKGNIYEGDGRGVTLAKGVTIDQIKTAFQKENNKKENDFSDIIGLYNTLHSPDRLARPTAWRADLESRFEVKEFLKWLAMSAVLEHWDTYGNMTHNFYLYNKDGKLHWISWDHNLILGAGFGAPPNNPPKDPPPMPNPAPPPGGGGKPPGSYFKISVTFDRAEVKDKWPLIRFILDDAVYGQEYKNQLKDMKSRYFNAAKIEMDLRHRAKTIKTTVAPGDQNDFEKSVDDLVKKIFEREQKLSEHIQKI
ncbi:hypothetical protein AZI86_05440 [Bdellovibrio bacteriovorus]|uniref:Spore coat protein CotH n=1 Tax=Bdellovibrio bacteriovorus TaxID=959 RepID=A0A150WPQ9_BDEBC|nr:CotH kinase family protein [Bdellovibrio bacteriovorus]KYG66491.1 hypothetical protein AZI86_05440 [Bdellovibrio bacteriovorus]